MKQRKSSDLINIALRLAKELDSGKFNEDLEPQEVAWLLRSLVERINALAEKPNPRPNAEAQRLPDDA